MPTRSGIGTSWTSSSTSPTTSSPPAAMLDQRRAPPRRQGKISTDSAATAGDRKYDVYMGIDVFGRNTFGGGQWNTNVALDLLKKDDVSTAIFAPGWIYETKQPPDFQSAQNRVMVTRYLLKVNKSHVIHGTIFPAKFSAYVSTLEMKFNHQYKLLSISGMSRTVEGIV
ncbi:hypothetical protein ZWY2020_043249 [Hordeum vulgare]|nr:hypothetical protein ZWY2020_043249 [Hordeum vulgare]